MRAYTSREKAENQARLISLLKEGLNVVVAFAVKGYYFGFFTANG